MVLDFIQNERNAISISEKLFLHIFDIHKEDSTTRKYGKLEILQE